MEEVEKTTKPQEEQTTPSPAYKSTLGAEVIDKTAKLHKQPRGLLKTTASNVGKDTQSLSLFNAPNYDDALQPIRETISKNTGIMAQYLMLKWQRQKNDEGVYIINNLSDIARELSFEQREIKNYLIYLGGFIYPVISREKLPDGKTRVSISNSLMFSVKWNFIFNNGKREQDYTNDDRIGTRLSNYIRELPVQSVEIVPNQAFIDELEGKGLGNIFVSDEHIAFSLGLSDMAYKILSLSGSNKSYFKIGFNKLVNKKHLNQESLIRGVYNKSGKRIRAGKGKPYVLTKIKEALTELQQAGHLQSWNYEEKEDCFSWNCTDKIYKYKDLWTHGDKGLGDNGGEVKRIGTKKTRK